MSVPDGMDGLLFACECVSARRGGYSDPWSAIAKHKLLADGTKEEILNLIAREPRTISQLAEELSLSPPSVHTHISEMMKSELLRESVEWEKKHPTERYYEPNFPIVKAPERARFESVCREMANEMAELFERRKEEFERVFNETSLGERGWKLADLMQYLYTTVQRGARETLEESGTLPHRQPHKNGAEWVFWAEEPDTFSSQK